VGWFFVINNTTKHKIILPSDKEPKELKKIVSHYNGDVTRLLDILWDIHDRWGFLDDTKLHQLAGFLHISSIEILDCLTFYHFFYRKNPGKICILVDNSIIAKMHGQTAIIKAFECALGVQCGSVDAPGEFGLYETPCMGLSDQAPAALIGFFPVTNLNPDKVSQIIALLRQGQSPEMVSKQFSDLVNYQRIKSSNSLSVLKGSYVAGQVLQLVVNQSSAQACQLLKASGLRGRGGAGFLTGSKWEMCANFKSKQKYIICNADEGEPGTFKDRVLLTRHAQQLIESMTIAARIVGADKGIIYLRAEYRYLQKELNTQLQSMRNRGLLGQSILAVKGFDFDIRIQLGAGSYVCGEESALIESLQGKRGEPRIRPPFPVEKGYMNQPTLVNNVETFCTVLPIFKNGAKWFSQMGTEKSSGTRLISVSGDCEKPGVYEIEWGMNIAQLLDLVGAKKPLALQVGGPSGCLVKATDSFRQISFEDLATGGSIMIFNQCRNLLKVVKNFMRFFVNESCGCCTPCRAGNVMLEQLVDKFIDGKARQKDLLNIQQWSQIIKASSRCGLGQTSSNPILTTYQAFPELFIQSIKENHNELIYDFDVGKATTEYDAFIAATQAIKP